MKSLKDHFKSIWEQEKKDSAKLFLFYNNIKLHFEKEPYLDLVKNAKSRYCTTRLRISAHNLEIEYGRYKNIPREQRKCKWCDLALNTSHLENEHHVLFECDLYANIRSKLVRTLYNTMGKIDCNLEIGQKNTQVNTLSGQLMYQIFQNTYSRYIRTVKTTWRQLQPA